MSRALTRVLHVGKFYPPVHGGMEQVLRSLCQATRGRLDSRVLVFNDAPRTVREVVDGIPVTRLASFAPARSTPIATSMSGELRHTDADVIILHEPNPWALVSCALARPQQPLAVWFHSEVIRPALQFALFYHPLVRLVYPRARRILVSSPALAGHAKVLAPYRDRVTVIPFGIDASRWQATPPIAARARDITAGVEGRPLILFAGRLVEYKGVDVLLRALAGLDAHGVIAGDGPLRGHLTELAHTMGLSSRVRFTGEIPHDELVALYHAADVFVLPSVTRAEAFGYVQLEAMAAGTPIVSTRLESGVPWVNQDGITGLTVTPGNAAELRDALHALLSDRPRRERMADAARQRVTHEFSLERMGDRLVSVVDELAG
ncbi:MAG TPA: glycosyltransferase [Vicinamibacterales bacterium]|nr:glycosyltransferase [Vicinamibacterales bacterium]